MKTSILAQTVSALALAKTTGLLFSFNFGKLHLQGTAQEVSVTTDGTAIKGDLYQIDRTIDFDAIELATLQKTVLASLNSDVVLTVTDDRELLVSHMFKTVCSSQSLKALKAINGIDDSEKIALDTLNRADTFMQVLLPRILCTEPVQRTKLATNDVFNFAEFGLDSAMFATGNKSVYTMPNNGGYKVYLLAEHKREFDDLVDNGLLSEEYGRNLVKEGDFTGCFAVLIPAKA